MRIYIAGRITGLNYTEVKNKFQRAEVLCRGNGWNPVNPTRHVNEKAPRKAAIRKCLDLLTECDAILLLNDYKESEGAHIEFLTARYAGMKMFFEEDLI